jgi:hypothetical protein
MASKRQAERSDISDLRIGNDILSEPWIDLICLD